MKDYWETVNVNDINLLLNPNIYATISSFQGNVNDINL